MTDKNDDVQKQLDDQQKTIDDYSNTLRRLQADFENYMKRVEREKADLTDYSTHKLLSKIINIVDDFEKAMDLVKNQDQKITQGIEMIHKQFHKILKEEGVVAINSVGHKLDPFKHEVLAIIDGEKDDVVVEELQKGYMFKTKVLRTSKVKITKHKEKK
jgi:molecular chaperone GrpE